MPHSELQIIPRVGHLIFAEPEIASAAIKATEKYRTLLTSC